MGIRSHIGRAKQAKCQRVLFALLEVSWVFSLAERAKISWIKSGVSCLAHFMGCRLGLFGVIANKCFEIFEFMDGTLNMKYHHQRTLFSETGAFLLPLDFCTLFGDSGNKQLYLAKLCFGQFCVNTFSKIQSAPCQCQLGLVHLQTMSPELSHFWGHV